MACPQPEDYGLVASLGEVGGVVGWVVGTGKAMKRLTSSVPSSYIHVPVLMRFRKTESCRFPFQQIVLGSFNMPHKK